MEVCPITNNYVWDQKLGSVSYNKQLCLGPKRCVKLFLKIKSEVTVVFSPFFSQSNMFVKLSSFQRTDYCPDMEKLTSICRIIIDVCIISYNVRTILAFHDL